MIQNSNNIKIDKTDLENKKEQIVSNVGVSEKFSNITDNSTINGWKNLISYTIESDEIRISLNDAEEQNIKNIETYNTIMSGADKTLADKM